MTQKKEKNLGLGKKWPKFLDNIWLQNFSFLTVSSFIGVLTTRPLATAIMLIVLVIVLPTILHLLFERRVFCRYVCPVSGFIGLYASAVRAKGQKQGGLFETCWERMFQG
ncbi:MAG: 4Fe-4S binding protein [Candidatus Caldarchaeum sp.]